MRDTVTTLLFFLTTIVGKPIAVQSDLYGGSIIPEEAHGLQGRALRERIISNTIDRPSNCDDEKIIIPILPEIIL